MTKKIFFGNYKGGVGKTTTVYEIGAHLANDYKKKVLLIDLDPQCSLTKICSKISDIYLPKLEVEETLNYLIELYDEYVSVASKLELLEGEIKTNHNLINRTIKSINKYTSDEGKLDFIPTVLDMKNARLNDIAEKLLKNSLGVLTISKLINDIITKDGREYDYILFDCPPTSNTIIQGVFLSSDYYLIPTISDEISIDGVADYITEIESTYVKYAYDNCIGGILLKKYFGNKPKLIGILPNIYKSRTGESQSEHILESLDKSITKMGIESLIKGTNFVDKPLSHIFNVKIRHLDNRSDPKKYGIPITISNGDIHKEYEQISKIFIEVLEDNI